MKIVKGKIMEATKSELLHYYITLDWDDIMPFETFKDKCKDAGTKVTEEEGGAE